MTLTIYQQACPRCAAIVLVSTHECECGYRLVNADAADTHDEELYTVYLAARVDQTLAGLESCQAELARNPGDFSRLTAVMRAVRDAQTARDELETHQRQVTQSVNRGIDVSATTPIAMPSAEPTPEFHHRQAAKAARIMESGYVTGGKACPRCHASAPPSTARCHCGHFFHLGPPLPAKAIAENASKHTYRRPGPDPGTTSDTTR